MVHTLPPGGSLKGKLPGSCCLLALGHRRKLVEVTCTALLFRTQTPYCCTVHNCHVFYACFTVFYTCFTVFYTCFTVFYTRFTVFTHEATQLDRRQIKKMMSHCCLAQTLMTYSSAQTPNALCSAKAALHGMLHRRGQWCTTIVYHSSECYRELKPL